MGPIRAQAQAIEVGVYLHELLDAHGFEQMAAEAVVVINALRGSSLVQINELEDHFRRRCRR